VCIQKIEVWLSIESLENKIKLTISDTGTGIAQEVKSQLFTPFFTIKDSGQGLGLMLVHEIFTLQGFSYKLTNNENAVGASFEVTIPGANIPLDTTHK